MAVPFEFYFAAFFALGMWSLAYDDNPYYRFILQFYVVGSLIHFVIISVESIRTLGIGGIAKGDWLLIIPMVLGILVFTRMIRGWEWISKWPIAITVGVGAGLFIRGYIGTNIIGQIAASVKWVFTPYNPWIWVNGLITALFALAGVSVFFFTREIKGVGGQVAWVGRMVIMFALGMNAAGLGNWYLQTTVTSIERLLATAGIIPLV